MKQLTFRGCHYSPTVVLFHMSCCLDKRKILSFLPLTWQEGDYTVSPPHLFLCHLKMQMFPNYVWLSCSLLCFYMHFSYLLITTFLIAEYVSHFLHKVKTILTFCLFVFECAFIQQASWHLYTKAEDTKIALVLSMYREKEPNKGMY